ncbi:hypothetical protein VE00_03748 [Pseudogymnoascus sp. WSF 3629]|nr:hypothetical protein VE00_03748 [Pseudogymnoascus sp. WSF 3629]
MDALEDYHAVLSTLYSLLSPILYPTLRFLNWARTLLLPLLRPLILQLTNAAHDSPAIVSLGVLLVTLYISMRVMGFMQRMVAFGARIIFALVFYGAIVVGGMMVYQRGVERTVGDVVGWVGEVQRIWVREYGRWEQVQNQASGGRQGSARERW